MPTLNLGTYTHNICASHPNFGTGFPMVRRSLGQVRISLGLVILLLSTNFDNLFEISPYPDLQD